MVFRSEASLWTWFEDSLDIRIETALPDCIFEIAKTWQTF